MIKKIIKGIELNENTSIYKVAHKYFIEQITNIDDIMTQTGLSRKSILCNLWHFNKKLSTNSSDNETETILPEVSNTNQILSISVSTIDNRLILKVKTNDKFEKWLIANKEIRTSSNLWNKEVTGTFYYLSIVHNNIDDANRPVFYSGMINFAILRIPGISQGLEFEIDGLLTATQIQAGVEKMNKVFKKFYKDNICERETINIQAEVVEEQ